jgi:hypothetical protein
MANLFFGLFLIIEGINRLGVRFIADEILKGIFLLVAGIILLVGFF